MPEMPGEIRGCRAMTPIDIAREYFPDEDEDFLSFVIWEHTGFPSFWNIPEDGENPDECLRKQLKELSEVTK